MAQTSAVEFQRNFGEYQHAARCEPVEITRHGRRELVLMSADHYDWLIAAAKRAHRTDGAADIVIDAVGRAEMDPEHAALDNLLKASAAPAPSNPDRGSRPDRRPRSP